MPHRRSRGYWAWTTSRCAAAAAMRPDQRDQLELKEADVAALPFDDGTFDTVVSTLAMCAVPDERVAIAEMRRLLRPGGRLLLLDHIGSNWWPIWAGATADEGVHDSAGGRLAPRRGEPL